MITAPLLLLHGQAVIMKLASALYQESVRVDEALVSNSLSQASLDQQQYQNLYNERQDTQANANTEYNKQIALADTMAAYGDFTGYEALGVDTTQMKAAYAQSQNAAASKGSSSGSDSASKPTH